MRVWTVQPVTVLNQIKEEGAFRCRKELSYNLSKQNSLKTSYEWLKAQMTDRIGEPPAGVEYPIWAWYIWEDQHVCPDPESAAFLKRTEDKVLLTLDIPEDELVLTDFDAWQIVMMDGYLMSAEEIGRQEELENRLASLTEEAYSREVQKSWMRVFDTSPLQDKHIVRGRYVQATFWEIKREYITETRVLKAVEE